MFPLCYSLTNKHIYVCVCVCIYIYIYIKAADVLGALHVKTRAQRDFQEALYGYVVNWLRLKRESGSLQAGDLQQLNSWLMADKS